MGRTGFREPLHCDFSRGYDPMGLGIVNWRRALYFVAPDEQTVTDMVAMVDD